MATSMSSLDPVGLKNFRKFYSQYQATRGTPPPSSMVSNFLQGEIDARLGRQAQQSMLGLQREGLAQQKEASDRSFALNQEQYRISNLANERAYAQQQRQYEDSQKAAAWQGGAQLVGTAAKVIDTFGWGEGLGKELYKAGEDVVDLVGTGIKAVLGVFSGWGA